MNKIDRQHLDVKTLENISNTFFKIFGTQKLLGRQFFIDLETNSETRLFEKLLIRCGFKNNAKGFFQALVSEIGSGPGDGIRVNGIQLPAFYVYQFLEVMLPGNGLCSIETVDQLEQRAFVRIKDKTKLQKVIDQYPVRLSDHVIRQSMVSKGVAGQYLPFKDSDTSGRKGGHRLCQRAFSNKRNSDYRRGTPAQQTES